jgi:2',3'-cyclic-nucleotide 2'-phosphodiesterase (5'-nucleotidase family)
VLLLDVGNFSDNPTEEGDIKTRALLEAMGRLGYGAANVGERDLASGYGEFVERTAGVAFPLISTNIVRRDTREPVFKPYTVLEVPWGTEGGTVRVGLLGVVRFNPTFLKSGPDQTNLVIVPPGEALKRHLPEVRERSDVVILMAAVHRDDAHLLAREHAGIDLILGSYGAIVSAREEAEGATRICYAGNQGQRFGETRIFLGSEKRIERTLSFTHDLTARYPSDPEMTEFVNRVAVKINELKGAHAAPKPGGPAEASPGAP